MRFGTVTIGEALLLTTRQNRYGGAVNGGNGQPKRMSSTTMPNNVPDFVGAKVIDGHVVIRWPVNEVPELSTSGKTKILATTGGFVPMMDNPKHKFSINCTVPKDF